MFFAYIDPGTGFTIFSLGSGLVAYLLGFLGVFFLFFKKIFKFLKNYRKNIIIALVIIALGTIMIGVAMNAREPKLDKKIVILGFDGLSPEIIEPMMQKGELPNFSSLKESGSYCPLSTTNPSQSPVAWTGFATGQNPGKNGIFDFICRDPKTYNLKLSLSNIRQGKAARVIKSECFWQYTSEQAIPTVIISCPVTFPPDKVRGRMLSGMGIPDALGTEGTFTFYTSDALSKDKDIGGKVFHVNKAPLMIMNLIGPKVSVKGQAENIKVPFKLSLQKDDSAIVEYQNRRLQLKKGYWSNWQEVTFKLGLFKKMKGIFRFYLIETEPEFKLYISPINFDPREPYFPISYPAGYSKELADNIGLYYTQGMPMDTWAVNERRLTEEPFLEQVNEVLKEKKAMLDFELNRLEKGVLFCYFESPDIIQHMFWRYRDPEHPLYEASAPRQYKEMIETWYKKMDAVLGSVLERLAPKDVLLVLSDHGFDTFRWTVHINSWLRANGYLKLKNPHAKSGAELLLDVDWPKTRAYSIGFGAIYINQQGREKEGTVAPGEETQTLKEEIARGLEKWLDPKYRKPLISKVYEKEDIFWGEYAKEAPDLYVGFNKGYRASWQTALGAAPEELIEDNLKKWSGSHLFDPRLIPGILFSSKKISKEKPSIYDLAPTILKVCGSDSEELKKMNLDGQPLF